MHQEGSEVFIANEGLIKQPSALSVHVYRLVWRQFLFLCHNLVIWVVLMLVFPRPLGWDLLLSALGLAVLMLNGVWVAMLFGILATRFRDIAPLLDSLVQLLFYMTPIVWTTQTLYEQGGEIADRARIAELNPLYHYLEIVRAPMIGQSVAATTGGSSSPARPSDCCSRSWRCAGSAPESRTGCRRYIP
jgi:ABC-2 type transport system permease protein